MSAWCTFNAGRISWPTDRLWPEIAFTDWARELLDLQRTGSWDGLQIFPDAQPAPDGHWQFPRISFAWEPAGSGYVVQCFETADSSSFILSSSPEPSEPTVQINLGGQAAELWPMALFVPHELALRALQHFLSTGLQDPGLQWIGLGAFPRRRAVNKPR